MVRHSFVWLVGWLVGLLAAAVLLLCVLSCVGWCKYTYQVACYEKINNDDALSLCRSVAIHYRQWWCGVCVGVLVVLSTCKKYTRCTHITQTRTLVLICFFVFFFFFFLFFFFFFFCFLIFPPLSLLRSFRVCLPVSTLNFVR